MAGETLPPFVEVVAAIGHHFEGLEQHQPGDLIARGELQAALDRVAELGWAIPQRGELEKRALSDEAYLVRKLRTAEGTRFMRRVANLPNGYDRLDRLSAMSGGRKLVDRLIHDKGGHEMIEYLSTSEGGRNLGRMLNEAQGGSNMNKPTGRVYTVDDLVNALEECYQEQVNSGGK